MPALGTPVVNQPTNLDGMPHDQLVATVQALQAQLGEARQRFHSFNSLFAAVLKEKHGGRCFVTIPTFAETQGWSVDFLPQKDLGNIRVLATDANGRPQVADDKVADPTDEPCTECGAPATFAEGVENGRPKNARCSAHLPPNAQVLAHQPIVKMAVPAKPEAEDVACEECGRKVGHNRDCKLYVSVN